MRRDQTEDIRSIVAQYLRQEGVEPMLRERQAVFSWPDVVGAAAAAKTTSISIRNHVLYVTLSSSVLRNELLLQRSKLIARLNECSAPGTVRDIVLR